MSEKITRTEALDALSRAKSEIERLEKEIDSEATTRDVTECSCNNPGCSGVEVFSYAAAVGGAFAGGVSG